MKDFITPSYIFTPAGSGVGTITLNISNFDVRRLVAILNQTRGVVIYSTADVNNRFTNLSGSTLTLNADTSTHSTNDVLQVIYNSPVQDDFLEFIYEAVKKLDFLSALRGVDGTLRVGLAAGTLPGVTTVNSVTGVSTVTTVSTLSNQTNIGGNSATPMIPALMNQVAILSNVNNVIVT